MSYSEYHVWVIFSTHEVNYMQSPDLYFIKKMHPSLSSSWIYFKKLFFPKLCIYYFSSIVCFVFSFKLEGLGFKLFILFAYEVPNKLLAFNISYIRVKTMQDS